MDAGTALVITAQHVVEEVTFDPGPSREETFAQVAASVGQGCVMHRLDPEVAAASLLRGDGARRNRHAEAVVRGLGLQQVPPLFGSVALLGLDDPGLPIWDSLCHLASFHHELIIAEHHRVLAST